MNTIIGLFRSDSSIDFEISLRDEKDRPCYPLELNNNTSFMFPIYGNQEDLKGKVKIAVPSGMRLDHVGITAELVGTVTEFSTGNDTVFLKEFQTLETPGTIIGTKTLKFRFKKVVKKYESYYGLNARVRYVIRIVASKSFGKNLVEERDIWIIKKDKEPKKNENIKMEAGITDYVHIEFMYDKSKYHLRDVINGNVNFIMAKVRIVHMDIEIIRKETITKGGKEVTEQEQVVKYEVMYGTPKDHEQIPVRLFLKPLDLTPTFSNVEDTFDVRYYLNLVIVDAEDRRFFKQHEITLWRDSDNPNDFVADQA